MLDPSHSSPCGYRGGGNSKEIQEGTEGHWVVVGVPHVKALPRHQREVFWSFVTQTSLPNISSLHKCSSRTSLEGQPIWKFLVLPPGRRGAETLVCAQTMGWLKQKPWSQEGRLLWFKTCWVRAWCSRQAWMSHKIVLGVSHKWQVSLECRWEVVGGERDLRALALRSPS